MGIRLDRITRENWYECSRLEVKPEQQQFVTSNLFCIAEVQFYRGWEAFAIYNDDRMVGFVMYEDDEEQDEWWISSLMIAADHQGKGYGKAALQALIPLMQRKGCQEIWVGYVDTNVQAQALYKSLGFREIGLDDEGDMIARLLLSNSLTEEAKDCGFNQTEDFVF